MVLDPVTGLPDLTSDVYQIPLNTDSLPYKDLQAEARLPRQPLLPDDIIPTVALLTGLRSDNTGEVVHTDDDHAAKVYVVNQPAPSSGGGGGSGGSGASRIRWRWSANWTPGGGGPFVMQPTLGPIGRYLYGFSIGLYFNDTDPYSDLSPSPFYLYDAIGAHFLFHVCFPRQASGNVTAQPFYNFATWLPRPADLEFTGLDVTTDCYIQASWGAMSYAVVIYTSDDP